MRLPKINRLSELTEIRKVKVFVHWSAFPIGAAAILLGALGGPGRLLALAGLVAYYGVIFIHECGHMVAAQCRGCEVSSIELYPIGGITRFSEPDSRVDQCAIAWGGVVAQIIVGLPLAAWVVAFGYTRFQPVNAILAILGFFSLSVAALNLVPIRPLDGAAAWRLLPVLFERAPDQDL
jgi:Zn-dependent protease